MAYQGDSPVKSRMEMWGCLQGTPMAILLEIPEICHGSSEVVEAWSSPQRRPLFRSFQIPVTPVGAQDEASWPLFF